MMTDDRRFLWALLAVAAVGIAVMPFLLGAEDPQFQRRRQQIATMTQPERERLQRNFEQFAKLSESDRAHFRDLHAKLEADRTNEQGRANAALEAYSQWLQTIPPFERDALQKEPDPGGKLSLVREVIDRQREDRVERRIASAIETRLGPIPTLSEEDLRSMLAVIEEAAEPALRNTAVEKELEGYTGLAKTLKMFELLGRKDKRLLPLLTESRMQHLVEAISDEEARQMLSTEADDRSASPNARKRKVVVTLWKNLAIAIEKEMRQRVVTSQKMETMFAKLPVSEQEKLLDLSPDEFHHELRRLVLDAESTGPINRSFVQKFVLPGDRPFRGNRRFFPNGNRPGPRDRPRRGDAKPQALK